MNKPLALTSLALGATLALSACSKAPEEALVATHWVVDEDTIEWVVDGEDVAEQVIVEPSWSITFAKGADAGVWIYLEDFDSEHSDRQQLECDFAVAEEDGDTLVVDVDCDGETEFNEWQVRITGDTLEYERENPNAVVRATFTQQSMD